MFSQDVDDFEFLPIIRIIVAWIALQSVAAYWSMLIRPPDQGFPGPWPIEVGEVLFCLIIHAVLGWTLWRLCREKFNWGCRRRLLITAGIVAFGIVLSVLYWDHFFIDDDEYFQSLSSLQFAPLRASIGAHQQPLDYGPTRLWSLLLGINQFSIRFSHAVLGVMTLVSMYLLLTRWKVRNIIAVAVTVAFALSYGFFRFSHESRPQILSFLTSLIFFYFFKLPTDRRIARVDFLIAAVLFALSIGLQPVFFLTLWVFICFWTEDRREWLDRLPLLVLAVLPACINNFVTVLYGPSRIASELFVWNALKDTLHAPLFSIFLYPYPWSILFCVIMAVLLLFERTRKQRQSPFLLALFFQCLFFAPFFSFAFKLSTAAGVPIFQRYFILAVIPLWLGLGLAAERLFSLLPDRRLAYYPAVFSVLLLFGFTLEPKTGIDILHRQDAAGMYGVLSKDLKPDDWVVPLVIHEYNLDDSFEFITSLEKKQGNERFHYLVSPLHYLDELYQGRRPRRLILLFLPYAEELSALERQLAQFPFLKPFGRAYSYLAYQYDYGAKDPTMPDLFLKTLAEKILISQKRSVFQVVALRAANLVLSGDSNRLASLIIPLDQTIETAKIYDVTYEWEKFRPQLVKRFKGDVFPPLDPGLLHRSE